MTAKGQRMHISRSETWRLSIFSQGKDDLVDAKTRVSVFVQ